MQACDYATVAPKWEDDHEDSSLRSRLEKGEGKQLNVVIPADLHKRLKVQSVLEDQSMSEIVADALRKHLNEY